jgi:2-hydroxychromene-2-carboxylate isomerase
MGRQVEFVFGLGSRYSYLASTQLDSIAARTGCEFTWVPVSSVALMAAGGLTPFAGEPQSGQYLGDYRRRDAQDWAAYYGVPFVEPQPAPEDHRLMAGATLAAGLQDALVPYAKALLDAVFVRHLRIDLGACTAVAATIGLNSARFRAALEDPATARRVDEDATRYAARGAFGVPTFFAGERMFWGNDRLVLLEHWLKAGP